MYVKERQPGQRITQYMLRRESGLSNVNDFGSVKSQSAFQHSRDKKKRNSGNDEDPIHARVYIATEEVRTCRGGGGERIGHLSDTGDFLSDKNTLHDVGRSIERDIVGDSLVLVVEI